jgi:hypothetical protein
MRETEEDAASAAVPTTAPATETKRLGEFGHDNSDQGVGAAPRDRMLPRAGGARGAAAAGGGRTHSWLRRRTSTAALPSPRRTFRGSHAPPRLPRAPPSRAARAPSAVPKTPQLFTAPTRPSVCACARFTVTWPGGTRRRRRADTGAVQVCRVCQVMRASVCSTTRSCLAPAARAPGLERRPARDAIEAGQVACRAGQVAAPSTRRIGRPRGRGEHTRSRPRDAFDRDCARTGNGEIITARGGDACPGERCEAQDAELQAQADAHVAPEQRLQKAEEAVTLQEAEVGSAETVPETVPVTAPVSRKALTTSRRETETEPERCELETRDCASLGRSTAMAAAASLAATAAIPATPSFAAAIATTALTAALAATVPALGAAAHAATALAAAAHSLAHGRTGGPHSAHCHEARLV